MKQERGRTKGVTLLVWKRGGKKNIAYSKQENGSSLSELVTPIEATARVENWTEKRKSSKQMQGGGKKPFARTEKGEDNLQLVGGARIGEKRGAQNTQYKSPRAKGFKGGEDRMCPDKRKGLLQQQGDFEVRGESILH